MGEHSMNNTGPEKPPGAPGLGGQGARGPGVSSTQTRKPLVNTPFQASAKATEATLQPSISDDATQAAQAGSDAVKRTAHEADQAVKGAAASLTADVKDAAQSLRRAASGQATEFASDVGHELKQTAEQQKTRGVDALKGFAHAIETAAGELEGQSPGVARHIREAAKNVEGLSNNLRNRSVDELMHAASDLARSQPGVFIAGAVAAGFALSRFLKSSAPDDGARPSSPGSSAHVSPRTRTAAPDPYFPAGSVSPKI
jgi:hypothetical protein